MLKECEFCHELKKCYRRFCSIHCYWNSLKGKSINAETQFKKGHIPWDKGVKRPDIAGLNRSRKGIPINLVHTEEFKKRLSESKKGDKNYNWKGGVVSLKDIIFHSKKYSEWRIKVFQRDNFSCTNCEGQGPIQAHHIIPKSVIFFEENIQTQEQAMECERLWDLDNGITLCESCHKMTDTWGAKSRRLISDRVKSD